MKVIDLLNKIANGEEVPKKVRFAGIIFEYNEAEKMYINDEHKNICDYAFLDDEVKILEEEKKTPEKLDIKDIYSCDDCQQIHINFKSTWNKINETIDCLDYIKSKGDK